MLLTTSALVFEFYLSFIETVCEDVLEPVVYTTCADPFLEEILKLSGC